VSNQVNIETINDLLEVSRKSLNAWAIHARILEKDRKRTAEYGGDRIDFPLNLRMFRW